MIIKMPVPDSWQVVIYDPVTYAPFRKTFLPESFRMSMTDVVQIEKADLSNYDHTECDYLVFTNEEDAALFKLTYL